MADRFNPYHAPSGSSEGGQFTSDDGGSGESKDKSGKLSKVGKIPAGGNDLKWKSEDTIKGKLVIEVPDDFDISNIKDADLQAFIKENLPGTIGHIESDGDIENIKIIKTETGKGYIRVDLDITPTAEAGNNWAESTGETYTGAAHRGGGSMSTVQEIWERVKAAFVPAIEARAAYPWDQCIADQMKKYGSKEKAEKICGAIKAKYGGRADATDIFLPDGFDLETALKEIEAEFNDDLIELSAQETKLIDALSFVLDLGLISPDILPQARDEHTYHTAKMKKCLKHLEAQGADPGKAHRICYAALGEEANRTRVLPTQTRSFTITRDAQGVPRWLMIAASAVVNKVGAIDSTALFDNFIKHAMESGEYPVLDFFHEGDRVRFGKADWLKRDGALYLASGGFDDTELARGAVAGLESQADYWGASIAYRVTQAPLMLVADGEIPVYQYGINNFISIVPKRLAANYFTATLVAEEVMRMNTAVYEELVKLVGEERAKQFAAQVDDANRTITETGMVTRAEEAPPIVAEVNPVIMPPAEVPPIETRQDAPPEKPDDLSVLKAQIADLMARVSKLEESTGANVEESKRAQERAVTEIADLTTRLAQVEEVKARWLSWVNDAPEHIKVEADKIYRARDQEQTPMTLAQIAEQSLAKMNRTPHRRQP
jgi:hypothetical protein